VVLVMITQTCKTVEENVLHEMIITHYPFIGARRPTVVTSNPADKRYSIDRF
jgi:hypothetical protein